MEVGLPAPGRGFGRSEGGTGRADRRSRAGERRPPSPGRRPQRSTYSMRGDGDRLVVELEEPAGQAPPPAARPRLGTTAAGVMRSTAAWNGCSRSRTTPRRNDAARLRAPRPVACRASASRAGGGGPGRRRAGRSAAGGSRCRRRRASRGGRPRSARGRAGRSAGASSSGRARPSGRRGNAIHGSASAAQFEPSGVEVAERDVEFQDRAAGPEPVALPERGEPAVAVGVQQGPAGRPPGPGPGRRNRPRTSRRPSGCGRCAVRPRQARHDELLAEPGGLLGRRREAPDASGRLVDLDAGASRCGGRGRATESARTPRAAFRGRPRAGPRRIRTRAGRRRPRLPPR